MIVNATYTHRKKKNVFFLNSQLTGKKGGDPVIVSAKIQGVPRITSRKTIGVNTKIAG